MTKTQAQGVLGTMLMRYDLTDAELEAIGLAGEALEREEWISVEKMLPQIRDDEGRTSDYVLIADRWIYKAIAQYDYRHKEWVNGTQHYRNVTHWRLLPEGPEEE